ncbi:MAG: helix-turn-helix domain-containing protein [Ruminococcaceae bacterium]|nr:helix-turn-helix domain-containing protein [Oscillospiraceae bacterium]
MKYQLENFNGSYDFRCGFHHGWHMEKHIHEYCELLYCQKGTAYVFINGRKIRLPEGYLVWISQNCIHQYRCENADVICAVFSHDFIPLYFEETKGARPVPRAVDVAELSPILDSFPGLDKSNRLLISGYLNLICARVLEQSELEKTDNSDGILYQKVVAYLAEHFREDISLKSLAKMFGYNEKYLSHCLHSLTGLHFSKLLALYRVEQAKKCLAEGRGNIAQIAVDCGFSALNTFNRSFRELTGLTPSVYKKTASQF